MEEKRKLVMYTSRAYQDQVEEINKIAKKLDHKNADVFRYILGLGIKEIHKELEAKDGKEATSS